ncbi:MAG: hypothetical protein J7M26_07940, partial [Armatimonadetes bacterium]|nr:hypothetical protein [Armatimonadota bacterium]
IDVEVSGGLLGTREKLAAAKVLLQRPEGQTLASARGEFDQQVRARLQLDIKKVPAGDCALRLQVTTPAGQTVFDEVVEKFAIPPTPKWLGNREGISDKVLPPWTPIKVRGSSVRPWGRDYRWGALPFPESVVTRGEEMLTGPVRLIAVVNGKQQVWMGGKPVFTKKTPARVEFTTHAEGQDASLRGTLWCEYDGCVKCDWELVPKKRAARLDKLVFQMPYRAEHAKYIYHYPGRWRSAYNAGAVPPDGLTMAFRPFIWLGDEWRGLAWFCPSDQGFRPADPQKLTQVVRDGKAVLLQINLVEKPVTLDKPFRTTFGFQATPIRHNPQDVWDYRIVHTGAYGLEDRPWSPPMTVTWPAEGNFNVREGTLEAWVRPRFDPQVPLKPDDPGRGRYNRNFFLFKFGGYTVGYYWNIDDRGMRLYVKAPDGKYPIILGANNGWKKGEWHHIAVSWGKEIRLYDNGKLLARRPYKGLLLTTPENLLGGKLTVGSGRCDMDVDELCISDVQREPRGHAGPLKPDDHTLLLEDFSQLKRSPAGVETVPRKAGGGPGAVVGPAQLVAGKFGTALTLAYVGPKLTTLDRYEQLGVKTICFHEHWSRIQNYFAPADPEGLHRLVEACHKHGIRLLVYYGYELSDIAPEWETYRDEVLIYPRGGGYHRQPEQHCYICCYHSAWQDYLAWAIARTMDEYDMDGVYLDGTANPFGCANVGHGCGYIGEDGKPHRTYPFFSTRQMMKRIYTIVKTRKPDGLVNVHQSTCMTIPSVGWATSYWDGEQFGSIPRGPNTWPLDLLPLDAFRTEFMGHNWGVPAELLCYRRPYTYAEALALTLPHDVLVRPNDVELASKIWKAAAAFGRKQARWLPYWENRQWVKVNDDDVKCSLYTRGRRGVLVVVSNLGKEPVEARLWLNWRALDLPRDLKGWDALTGEPVECGAGRLRLQMQPLEFRLLRLEPAAEGE